MNQDAINALQELRSTSNKVAVKIQAQAIMKKLFPGWQPAGRNIPGSAPPQQPFRQSKWIWVIGISRSMFLAAYRLVMCRLK